MGMGLVELGEDMFEGYARESHWFDLLVMAEMYFPRIMFLDSLMPVYFAESSC